MIPVEYNIVVYCSAICSNHVTQNQTFLKANYTWKHLCNF